MRPVRRRHAAEKGSKRAGRKRAAIVAQRRCSISVEDVAQREKGAACHQERQGLETDSECKSGQRAGRPASPAESVQPYGCSDDKQYQPDVTVLILDPP